MAMAESFGEAGGKIRPEKKENQMLPLIAKQRASCINTTGQHVWLLKEHVCKILCISS